MTPEPAYVAMLDRLCRLAGIPAAEHAQAVAQQAMTIDGLPTHFRLEAWSGFIKIYIEIGRPAPATLPTLCQSIVEHQLMLPAPFTMLTALDPDSSNLVLYGCAPLAADSGEDESFLAFLQACADAAHLLRNVLGEDVDR
ncbi:hypothetical protein [Noviherbaspirillum suwonense]|jgi:hypothetical protein|uniref:Type III secretion system chaperone n=1 Tax=Noviherbaspirillum suwonense TaxID=1224511 RepID=A0ABY1QRX6_9BURK|nr:hypothetical protein [Noviherbaspirillum suwonense]SMP78486.1 hypothetical protein SAMN06295970_1291 [Noviherbaspirillum suwonense]